VNALIRSQVKPAIGGVIMTHQPVFSTKKTGFFVSNWFEV